MTDTNQSSEDELELQLRMIIAYARNGDPKEPKDTYVQQIMKLIKAHSEKVALEAKVEENKRWLTILAPSMDENVAYNSDFHDRINELQSQLNNQDKEAL